MIEKTRKSHPLRWVPLPPSLQKPDDSWNYHRGAALAIILLIATVTSCVGTFLLFLCNFVWNIPFKSQFLMALFSFTILFLQLWVLLRFDRVRMSATIFSATTFLLTLIAVILTGGYHSAFHPLFLCSIVIAFRITSRIESVIVASLVTLAGIGFALAEHYGYTFPVMSHAMDRRVSYVNAWVVSLIIFSACMYTYHHRSIEPED